MPVLDEKTKKNQNEINIYQKYIGNNILYYIFKSLTRKADVRNYLCSILPDNILRVENFRSPLSVEIGRITDYLNNLDERKRILAENRNTTLNPSKYNGNSGYLKRLSASSNFFELKHSMNMTNKKLSSRLTLQNPQFPEHLLEIESNEKTSINQNNNNSHKSDKNLTNLNDLNLENNKSRESKDDKIDIDIIEVEEEEIETDEINDNICDPFLKTTETTLDYIKKKLKEYEDMKPNENFNHNTIIAMKDYLNHLINDLNSEEIKIEKYSNMIILIV